MNSQTLGTILEVVKLGKDMAQLGLQINNEVQKKKAETAALAKRRRARRRKQSQTQ